MRNSTQAKKNIAKLADQRNNPTNNKTTDISEVSTEEAASKQDNAFTKENDNKTPPPLSDPENRI